MNRRNFLKSFSRLITVGFLAPKLLLAEEKQIPTLAPYTGRTRMDVGYWYIPYIPLQLTDTKMPS